MSIPQRAVRQRLQLRPAPMSLSLGLPSQQRPAEAAGQYDAEFPTRSDFIDTPALTALAPVYNRIGTSYQRGYWPPLASSIYEQTNALYDKHDLYPSETCGLFLLGTEEENCNISSDRTMVMVFELIPSEVHLWSRVHTDLMEILDSNHLSGLRAVRLHYFRGEGPFDRMLMDSMMRVRNASTTATAGTSVSGAEDYFSLPVGGTQEAATAEPEPPRAPTPPPLGPADEIRAMDDEILRHMAMHQCSHPDQLFRLVLHTDRCSLGRDLPLRVRAKILSRMIKLGGVMMGQMAGEQILPGVGGVWRSMRVPPNLHWRPILENGPGPELERSDSAAPFM